MLTSTISNSFFTVRGTGMASKHHEPEEIVPRLRQVEVLVGQGRTAAEGARAYDFVQDLTRDGRKLRMLNVVELSGLPGVDEFTRECLCVRVGRELDSADVINVPAELFITRGHARVHPYLTTGRNLPPRP